VTINGGTRSLATITPLTSPANKATPRPVPNPNTIAISGATPALYESRIVLAETTDDSPMIQPTDRSMPPAMITNVWPRPINTMDTMFTRMFCEFRMVKKPVPCQEK